MNDVDIFEINEAFASQVSLGFSALPGPQAAQWEPVGKWYRGGACS